MVSWSMTMWPRDILLPHLKNYGLDPVMAAAISWGLSRQTSVLYTGKHWHICYDDIQLPYMHAAPKRVSAHYKLSTESGTSLCFAHHTSLSVTSAKWQYLAVSISGRAPAGEWSTADLHRENPSSVPNPTVSSNYTTLPMAQAEHKHLARFVSNCVVVQNIKKVEAARELDTALVFVVCRLS